ncbi:MAG: hypothetical protein L3J83_00330 [Proteobacteria bacterium]|nr:hypothetical protein [Pseudomonadota bacterium]
MKHTLPIINLDNQWYLMHGAHLHKIDRPDSLDGTNVILTDFNDAVFGLETVSGPVEHSAALIEKRLRDIGLLDGPSKIIVHNTRKIGDTATVLFTAIPAESYADYFELVNRQTDHCLVVPVLSVLAKQIDTTQTDGQVIVFHHNREFDLLIVKDKRIRKVSRFTSFSTSDDDVNSTLDSIAEEINTQNNEVSGTIKSIKWLSFLEQKEKLSVLPRKLSALTNIDIIEGTHTDVIYQDNEYKTSMYQFFNNVNAGDSANDNTSQVLYKSEKLLPLVSVMFLAIIISLVGVMWKWNSQISNIEQELSQSNQTQLEADIDKIKSDLAQSNRQFANNRNAQKTSQWLYNLNGIQSAPDPKQLVDDIGNALPDDVQVTGISLDSRKSPATVILDGVIEKPLKLAMKDLENMSAVLLNNGYKMLTNSSIELNDNNDFRMTLKVDYNDK